MKIVKTNPATGEIVSVLDNRTIQETRAQCLNFIRYLCSDAISSAGLDTATQQNAALGIYEPARCEAIKNYIAACRNEYLRCKALILAATTNDECDAVHFVGPSLPSEL